MAVNDTTLRLEHFTVKHGLTSVWTNKNPVLLNGEIGVESDTGKFKIGDGTKSWLQLPYASMTVDEIMTALAGKANISAIPAVIDNLISTSSISALSANQGKVLNEKIPSIANNLTTTTTGKTLDATQGKALKDLIDAISAITTIAVA